MQALTAAASSASAELNAITPCVTDNSFREWAPSSKITQVVRRRKGTVKACYEKQLERNPRLSGRVKLQFTILESGRVGSTRILEDTIGDAQVGRCIAGAMKRWRFPKPEGGSVTIAFPFAFAPSG